LSRTQTAPNIICCRGVGNLFYGSNVNPYTPHYFLPVQRWIGSSQVQ